MMQLLCSKNRQTDAGEMAQMLLCALQPGLDRFVGPSKTLWEILQMGELTPHILYFLCNSSLGSASVTCAIQHFVSQLSGV